MLANGEDAHRSQLMDEDTDSPIETAVTKRRSQLQALQLREVGREFERVFDIRPDYPAGRENLMERDS
jgi:hypothetical protein